MREDDTGYLGGDGDGEDEDLSHSVDSNLFQGMYPAVAPSQKGRQPSAQQAPPSVGNSNATGCSCTIIFTRRVAE